MNEKLKYGEIIKIESKVSDNSVKMLKNVIKQVQDVSGNMRSHEAAEKCGYSNEYFSRIFRSVMGMSFSEYARSVRLAEAERRLKCTDDSVTVIASLLGYSTTSHFIEDFKREKGVSTKKYRNMS